VQQEILGEVCKFSAKSKVMQPIVAGTQPLYWLHQLTKAISKQLGSSYANNGPVQIIDELFVVSTNEVVEKALMNSVQRQQVACCKRLQQKHHHQSAVVNEYIISLATPTFNECIRSFVTARLGMSQRLGHLHRDTEIVRGNLVHLVSFLSYY